MHYDYKTAQLSFGCVVQQFPQGHYLLPTSNHVYQIWASSSNIIVNGQRTNSQQQYAKNTRRFAL